MRPLAQPCEPANNDRSSGGSAQERAAWIRGVALRIGCCHVEKRHRGFYGFYNRLVGRAIQLRWSVLLGSFVFLLIGGFAASHLKSQFFPEDVQYWFYLDIWLPNDVPERDKRYCHEGRAGGTQGY